MIMKMTQLVTSSSSGEDSDTPFVVTFWSHHRQQQPHCHSVVMSTRQCLGYTHFMLILQINMIPSLHIITTLSNKTL